MNIVDKKCEICTYSVKTLHIPKHQSIILLTINLENGKKRTKKPITSKMYSVNPKDRGTILFKLLLILVKGATSFEDWRTGNDVTWETFFEAAKIRTLVEKDK